MSSDTAPGAGPGTASAPPAGSAPPDQPARQPVVGGAGIAWRVVGGMLSVLLIALGVLSAASWLARRTEVQDATYRGTVSRVTIAVGSGDVVVAAGSGDEVKVHRRLIWTFNKPVLRETRSGGSLRLGYECPAVSFGPGCGINYRVTVPANVSLRVTSGAGDVTVNGLAGTVSVSSGSGNIQAARTSGALTLHASSGGVDVVEANSPRASVWTGSGDVSLDFDARPGEVSVATGSGDVTVLLPRGDPYRVIAQGTSGDALIAVAQSRGTADTISVSTGSGDILVAHRPPRGPCAGAGC